MKYNKKNLPLECIMTNSTCYCSTYPMQIYGIIIHMVSGQSKLKNFVQPIETTPKRKQLLDILGKNLQGTDLNHTSKTYGVNAWIGETEDSSIISIQTLPWNYRAWGCGVGKKGTCNDGWIQNTICQNDNFEQTYMELCKLSSYLCQKYNINPTGEVLTKNNQKIPTILTHSKAYQLGFCQRDDNFEKWLKQNDKTIFNIQYYIQNNINILNNDNNNNIIIKQEEKKYKVNVPKLNVRAGAGYDYMIVEHLYEGDVIRITDIKNNFGRLKHMKGWVDTQYVKEIK